MTPVPNIKLIWNAELAMFQTGIAGIIKTALKKLLIKINRVSVSGKFHALMNVGIKANVFAAAASKTAMSGELASCQNSNAAKDRPPQIQSNQVSCQ